MRSYLVLLFSFVAVIQFYGCDNGASNIIDSVKDSTVNEITVEELDSKNLRFNGKYRGNLSGTLTYYQHENSDMVIDSSVTASLVLTSASTKIELTESDLADYLE